MPITIRLTVDCKRAELSVGLKISPEIWNQQARMAIGSSIEARQINTAIDRMRSSLIRHYDVLSAQHDYVSAAMVKAAYKGKKPVQSKSLMEAVDFVLSKMEKRAEKGKIAKSTFSRWKTTKSRISMRHPPRAVNCRIVPPEE